MNVQYSPATERSTAKLPLLKQISAQLAGIVRSWSMSVVAAEWDRVSDPAGQELYRLSLFDSVGRVATDFTADELDYPLYVRVSLYRLWGDLIQIHSDLQHERVEQAFSQFVPE